MKRYVSLVTVFSLTCLITLFAWLPTPALPPPPPLPIQVEISGVPALTGATYQQAYAGDLPGATTTDIYTCPSGKRAIVGVINFYNHDAAGRTVQVKIKSGGVYYKTSQPIGMSANAANSSGNGNQGTYILEPGDTLAIHVYEALAPSINVIARLIEFSDLTGLKTVRLNALTAGLNTLYTCPANRRAALFTSGLLNAWDRTGGAVVVVNNSGAARSIQTYYVPSGGSATAANQFSNFAALANTSVSLVGSAGHLLSPGDSIQINVDAGGGELTAYATVFELPL